MKKSTNLTEHDLVQFRQQQMEEIPVGMLRTHGKLWGMDVFSWNKPNLHELENTLMSFPAPITWFANKSDAERLLTSDKKWLSKINLLCTHDGAGLFLENQVLDQIQTVSGAKDMDDLLQLLPSLTSKNGVLLFTFSGDDWKASSKLFHEFLAESKK
jgi:hypothetical protein